ncbi:MAG: RNA polymerase sigma factor [Kofleriaceae bacterium]
MIDRLRAGDEACFTRVVSELDPTLRYLARGYVKNDAMVDEVLQDTWVAVLRGIDRFAGRSSLRTWVCSILLNRARTVAARDARMVLAPLDTDDLMDGVFTEEGAWASEPRSWSDASPARILASKQALAVIAGALAELPERQREVLLLRDVYGWTAGEVCEALDLAETNQRVLLHRGRARLRAVLDALVATHRLELT